MTKKYYVSVAITAPFLCGLIAFSTLNPLLSLAFGAIIQVGLITAGYYLGKREHAQKE